MIENRFRNRMVGVITLVIILIFVLPAIFQKKSKYVEPSIPLVHKSDDEVNSDNFSTAEPVLPLTLNEADEIVPNVEESEKIESTPSTANATIGQGYVVQLVALKNARRIEGLVALLVLNNFSVYTKPAKLVDGQLNILYVGPFESKKQAESELIALKTITKLTGQVKKYP